MTGSGGELLLRAFAWLSLGAWTAGEWLRSARGELARWPRPLFTAGLAAIVIHSVLAFVVRYDFSWQAALVDAARQIEAVTGRPSSPRGFYLNYVFIAWWSAEAAAWWLAPAVYARRPRSLVWASRFVFAFMFANGAIVFARGPVRAFGALALLAAAAAWLVRGRRRGGRFDSSRAG